jgi:hypothetical protein
MKAKLLVIAVLICIPSLGFAQTESCPGCILGVFDAADLVHNYGTFSGFQKKLYVGIKYDPQSTYDGATGIELSIQGLPATSVAPSFVILNNGIKVGDLITTPADTTDPTATGGWNVVWSECQPGNQVFIEITLITFDPIPNDTVIRVLRKFPATNPTALSVLFTQCNTPFFTVTTMSGGCYVLNPTVNPGESVGDPPCLLTGDPVEAKTWSGIKQLFR